jgi:hypothetical protein
LEQIRKGYVMRDKVIRPTIVRVAVKKEHKIKVIKMEEETK